MSWLPRANLEDEARVTALDGATCWDSVRLPTEAQTFDLLINSVTQMAVVDIIV